MAYAEKDSVSEKTSISNMAFCSFVSDPSLERPHSQIVTSSSNSHLDTFELDRSNSDTKSRKNRGLIGDLSQVILNEMIKWLREVH
jgi:hypothetical protein